MTMTLTPTTQVHRDDHGLLASCSGCGLTLRQVEGFDPDIALGTLYRDHPPAPQAVHRATIPAGWRNDTVDP